MKWTGFPALRRQIYEPGGIPDQLRGMCGDYRDNLADQELLASPGMKRIGARLWWIGSALILGLGGYLLAVALSKGESIVAVVLCPMALIGVIALAFACLHFRASATGVGPISSNWNNRSSSAHLPGYNSQTANKPASAPWVWQMRLEAGRKLGHYQILAPLGAGGMGEVYRARDARLDRDVAVKVLPERLVDSEEALTRFEREAKGLAALSHPNLVTIFDVGSDQGISFEVMEFLTGETLHGCLARRPLPLARVLDMGLQWRTAWQRRTPTASSIAILSPRTFFWARTDRSKSSISAWHGSPAMTHWGRPRST